MSNQPTYAEVRDRMRRVCSRVFAAEGVYTDMHKYAQASRVECTLTHCLEVAYILGGESMVSFDNCLRSMEGGMYDLRPDRDALCVNFTCCGMHGAMIFHTYDKTWSLHT